MSHSVFSKILYGGDYNPEQWSEDVWCEDMRLMKLAHVNMVSINIFSWAALEPEPDHYHFETLDRIMDMLAENGIAADLATATASPPTWMSRLYPSILPVNREGQRLFHGSRRHYCPNSPDYLRKIAALVQRLAERYRQHPALCMWHLNNEYGCHLDVCYCDNCAQAFRLWLQDRYQSLEAVNEAWGTNFWSQRYFHWDDILPPRITPAQHNPGQVLDYQRFMSDSFLKGYRVEENILRATTPDIPLTTNLMTFFKPIDGFAWAPHMDIISFDMYPTNTTPAWWNAQHHDIMRSLKQGKPHMVMEQSPSQVNWREQNPHKRPGQMRLHALQAVARGADGMAFFQWRQSQAGAEKFHSAVVTHDGNEHTRIFKQAAQVGLELALLSPHVVGSRIKADVAIVMDWENWWALEYLPGPSDRIRYTEQLSQYYHALHRLHIAIDFVTPTQDLSQYRVVIAPALHMLKTDAATNLERFVENGGNLIVSFFSGIVDEHDHVFLGGYPGPLRKLLGIHVEEFDPWTPEMVNAIKIHEGKLTGTYSCELWGELIHLEGAQALATFENDYLAGGPAITVNHFGQGNAYYIATQPVDHLLHQLVENICQQAHIQPLLNAPEEVEVTKRVHADGRTIYFILNHSEQKQVITLPDNSYRSLFDDRILQGSLEIASRDVVVLTA